MELTTAAQIQYPLMEHYYTLQGEGYHTGKPAYFIRLGGCDVGCVWCDVKDSWDATKHPTQSISEIVGLVTGTKARIAVITGGEPAMHNLTGLCDAFREAGINTHIETSGAYLISGKLDWVTVSPKKFKAPLAGTLAIADELKVVIAHPSDFDWAEQNAAQVGTGCRLYLQAEWGKKEKFYPMITAYVKENPQWQLSLQTHKYINIL